MSAEQTWRDQGLCGQSAPDLFFSEAAADQEQAKALCASCPSLVPCTVWALAHGESYGVIAGMTADELRAHPDYRRADGAFAYVEETDESRANEQAKRDARNARRRAAWAASKSDTSDGPAMDGFDSLVHPFDEEAGR